MKLRLNNRQLPQTWTEKSFSEIAILERGHNPPKSQFINSPKEGYVRFYQIRDGHNDDYEVYVPDTPQLHRVKPDDILMVAYRHIGRVFKGADGAFNVALCKIQNKDHSIMDDNYLFYIIPTEFVRGKLMERAERSLIPSMSVKHLAQIKIPVPPLSEQQRIVEILDNTFEGIDCAIANTEKNLVNARELFESYLNATFTQKGDEWVETTLGKEIELKTGFAFKSKYYTDSPDSIRLLRGDNIIQGSLRWEGVKKWPISERHQYQDYEISEGDVVLAMDRPWVKAGLKHALIKKDDLPCLLVQRVARLRSKKNLDNRFLFYLVSSSEFTKYLLNQQTGIGVPHISGRQIQRFNFFLPSIQEQYLIGNKLDNLKEETQRLEAIYQRKLEALQELKQSILHKAFTGELTNPTVKENAA